MSRVDQLLANPAIAAAGRWVGRRHPRVFAMHDVADLAAFDRQLSQLCQWFHPVSAEQVIEWCRDERPLPDRAAWFTFDDGDRTTVVDALPLLHRHGIPATIFVCPAFVDGPEPPWWEVVRAATDTGRRICVGGTELAGPSAVTALKGVDDAERRAIVDELLATGGHEPDPVTIDDLARWRDMGGDIGNHTWDHPCLDRCSPDEQRRQIDDGAQWLDRHGLWQRRLFAYPNGDRTDEAESHLADSGYELVALFDHALATRRAGPLRVSRLRLDAGASADRTAAVSSGWHSGLFSLRSRTAARREGAASGAGPQRRTGRSGL